MKKLLLKLRYFIDQVAKGVIAGFIGVSNGGGVWLDGALNL